MVRRSLKLAAVLAAVLLFIGLAVALSPQEAYAGDYNYTPAECIYMDCDYVNIHFTEDENYYLSSIHALSDAAWDACYDEGSGILYLKNYNGSSIRVDNAQGTQLTICLIEGNSYITTSKQFAIRAEGVRLIIRTPLPDELLYEQSSNLKLFINQAFESTGSECAGIANYWTGGNVEDITISGTAEVVIKNHAKRAGSGIYTKGYLEVTDDACLEVDTTFDAVNAYSSLHGEAVYALKGLTATTSGTVDLSAANRADWESSTNKVYALYMENGTVNLDPSIGYLSMAAIGASRAVCNETIPQIGYSYSGYMDDAYDTYAVSARCIAGDDYPSEYLAVNSYMFPDPLFKQYIRDTVDPDRVGWLDYSVFDDVDFIELSEYYPGIQSLRGINFISGLEFIGNEHGSLVEADLSNNTKLQTVYFWDNQIAYLNVCLCEDLVYLDVDNNCLTSLDVSDNVNLNTLYCGNIKTYDHYNAIEVLDVSGCPDLEYLYTRGNVMRALKIGENSVLKELYCQSYGDNDPLEILDLRGASVLRQTYTNYDSWEKENDGVLYKKGNSSLCVSEDTRVLTSDTDNISYYPVITSCKLNLAGKIGIRIYFKVPDNAKTARILYEGNGYSDSNMVSIDLTKSSSNPNYDAKNDRFVIDFPRITAREMTMRIRFFIVDDNGYPMNIYYEQEDMFFGKYFIYCAADWANRIMRTQPSEEALWMAASLLNYGDCAQKYLSNYNAARPANPRQYLGFLMALFEPDSENDMVAPYYVYDLGLDRIKLALEADTVMRIYCNKNVQIKVDGVSKKVYNSGDTYLAMIEGITSRNISKKYQIQIINGSDTATIQYSVLSWANDIFNREVYAAMPTAAALYFYNMAALDYIK